MQALREYPRLLYLGTAGVATALVFPLFGLWLLVCRCCCGACGGTSNRVESRADECWRCICFFSLGACCLFMMVAAGVAIVTELYTYAGISALLPYTKRFIQDMETGYLKTQHEIDTLLLKDYSIFENEMAQRLDNCVKLIEEDMESVLAANPALLAKKLVDRIVLLTADAVPLRDAANQYVAAASALQTRTNFSFGNPAIKDVLDQCLSVQPQVNACDPVMQTQADLQAQTENFTELAAIEDKIRNYSDVLRLASASLFVPAVNKAVDAKAKDVLMRRAQASVIQAKMRLKVLGDELGDLANAFYIDALEYPEDLLANVDKHFGRPYKRAEPLLLGYVAYSAALVCLLLLPPMLYLGGLAMVAWGTADGHCTYRSGRWCFSLGACLFVVFFGVVALFTTFGLVVTFFAMRCGCAIAADLTNPDVATPLRFLIQLVQLYTKDSSVPSKLATAVSMDHLLGIVMRFGVCPSEPRSAYHLVGESFVRNASRALGLEKELSFLWNGFNYEQLENQIGGIRLAIGSVLNVSEISALATPLESMAQVPLQAMDAREIQSQVEQISSEEENAVTLKTALQNLYQELASQPAFQKLVANATAEVDDIISDFTDCQLKKNVLQDALKKLESALEIDSRPIEVFMAETISALKNTKALQDQIDKVAAMIEPYKKNLADVIRGYGDYVVSQMKDTIGNCAPAYAMYESSVNVVCDGIVNPFGAYWLSVASCLAVGTVAMFMALCMSTLYSRKPRPPLPPPEPKPEPYFEPLAQPLLERGSPPPEYAKHVPEPTGHRVRRLVKGERESCIMESTDSGRGRSDSFAHSCSCIFGNTPPLYVLEDEDGNIKNKTSKEKKLGDEGRGGGGRIFRHAQTQTGEANEALEHRDADEVLHVAVKVEDEEGRMKSVEGTHKESTRERANVKNVSGREKGTAEDSRKGLAGRMTEEKKHHDGARLIHPSSTDVRVVLYDPPETRIRSAARNLWQRLLPLGRRSSLLRSMSSTTQSVGTRLFSRYRGIDEFSSRASLE